MVDAESTTLKLPRGLECGLHTWNATAAKAKNVRGVVVVYHGFLAHGRYPTVKYAAELLASAGFAVFALDMAGHGTSPGLRGYIDSPQTLVQDGMAVARHAHDTIQSLHHTQNVELPLFLVGSSMGGAIALKVATQLSSTQTKNIKVTGVVLLAPMLAVKVAEPLRYVLWCLAHTIPSLQVIGGSKASSSADQYRDPEKRAECDEDPLAIKGSQLRCASAWSCVELACDLRYHTLDQVTVPFLCLLANQDTVVDNAGSMELMDQSPSTDKTLKKYDALHGLLCEPQPLLGTIHSDILDWINKRCPAI